jgi:hypothetical protein
MTVVGWYGENAGGSRELRRVVLTRPVSPTHPLRAIIEAAQHIHSITGNRAEVVRLSKTEWDLIERSEELCAASYFCFEEYRPARDVVAAVTGLHVEVGGPAWAR